MSFYLTVTTTPSSIKSLKFAGVISDKEDKIEQQAEMFNYWKSIVNEDFNVFGVCKHEKQSKHIIDGNVMRETSYQILKNDDDKFIDHIIKNATNQNANMMFADIYNKNKDIVNTKVFKEFRKRIIKDHVKYVKKGKVRTGKGDYLTMVGNPVLMLRMSIKDLKINDENVLHKEEKLELKDNEIYTTFHDFDKKICGFRNPHASQSNVFVAKNTYVKDIDTYLDLSDNTVAVNSVGVDLLDRLNGSDFDSDVLLTIDDGKLLEISEKCFTDKYPVVINKVKSEKKPYK